LHCAFDRLDVTEERIPVKFLRFCRVVPHSEGSKRKRKIDCVISGETIKKNQIYLVMVWKAICGYPENHYLWDLYI